MKFHSTIVQVYFFNVMEIDLWVLSNILASYLEKFFTKIDIMKNWYLSHLLCVSYFFILWVCCALKVYLPFVVMKIVKIQDLRFLFITSDKAFMEILLGQKFFPNINYLSELSRNKLLFYQKYLLIVQSCYIT